MFALGHVIDSQNKKAGKQNWNPVMRFNQNRNNPRKNDKCNAVVYKFISHIQKFSQKY